MPIKYDIIISCISYLIIMSESLSTAMYLACDRNSPPGLVHPLLQENYDWVDKRLEEMYYGSDNDNSNNLVMLFVASIRMLKQNDLIKSGINFYKNYKEIINIS